MTPSPELLKLGPLTLYWYGFLITIGAIAGTWLASRQAKRAGVNPDHMWNALIPALIFGLIGARLYHVFSSPTGGIGWDYYRQNPIDIIAFWNGGLRGLGIYGAIIGGVFGLWVYSRFTKEVTFIQLLDFAVPGLALAQGIGRFGNYFNQELYGFPTTLPWGIPIDIQHRLPVFADLPPETRFQPTFLYEAILNFGIAALLVWISIRFRERLLTGDIFLCYLILYPMARFIVEFQRPDAWTVGGLPTAQWISIIIAVVSAIILIIRHRLQVPAKFGGTPAAE
ncbi:MAG: prolipoprotein diacylglyceryl transferase [Anaerolineae bacterium]